MRKLLNLGMIAAAAFLLTIGLATLGRRGHQTSTEGPVNPVGPGKSIYPVAFFGSAPQPSERDVADCNEYATWVVAREVHIDRIAAPREIAIDERLDRGSLTTVGTLEGLSPQVQNDPRVVTAYRQCMLRRGYNAWG